MKHRFLLTVFIVFIPFLGRSQIDLQDYLDQISIESIKRHVDTLASETMEGRDTGEPGQKLAAQYISDKFSKFGLKPINPDSENPYYQKFNRSK